jgi:hypothetical protein
VEAVSVVRAAWYVHTGTYIDAITGELVLGGAVDGREDRWIRWTTTGYVTLLALIAVTGS